MATVFRCEGVHAAITAAAKQVKKEKEYVIFADDKATVSLETAILEHAEGHAAFNVTVTSFTRYLSRSGRAISALSKEGSSMAIRRILAQSEKEGQERYAVLPSSLGKKNLSASLYEMIAQMKSACVTPQDLRTAAEGEEGLLSYKLKDLALLYARYEDYLKQEGLTDQGGFLSLLPPYLLQYRPLAGKEVFLVGYTSFTKQMQAIIAAILASGASVTAFFTGGAAASTNAAYTAFMQTAARSGERVQEFAEAQIGERVQELAEESLQAKQPSFDQADKSSPAALPPCKAAKHLRTVLCSVENYKGVRRMDTDAVGVFCAASPKEEGELVARRTAQLVRGGMRYRDIGIIAPDTAAYRPVLSAALNKYGIPFFADEKRTLASHPLYRFVADYLALFSHGLTAEKVFALVGSPYFSQKEGVSAFRNYVERFGVSYNRFLTEFTLNAPEKEGAEAVRHAFSALYAPMEKRAQATKYVQAITAFLQKSQALTANKTLAAAFLKQRPDIASFTTQAPTHLGRLLSEISRVLGDTFLSVSEFADILESGAQADEMNLIPTSIDAVSIAPPEKMLSSVKKQLFAVGMTDDVPAATGDTAFLSDKDLLQLERHEVHIDPRISEINARTLEETVEALTAFSEKLIVSYPAVTGKGESKRPSELVSLILKGVNNGDGSPKAALTADDYDLLFAYRSEQEKLAFAAQAYATQAAAEERFFEDCSAYADGEREDTEMAQGYYEYLRQEDEKRGTFAASALAARLGGVNEEKRVHGSVVPNVVSPTSLESYFHCPYAHFLDHVLHLSEKKTAEVNPMESGTFIHAVAENFALKMMEGGVKQADVPTLAAAICEEVAASEEYAVKRSSKRNEHIIDQLKEEAVRTCQVIYNQIARSDYRIRAAEQTFGYKEALKPPRLKAGKRYISLRGTIDRVDESDTHVRVIDYKTGTISTKEADLYAGTKAQLYLYMNTVMENYDKPLAGAYYFPVRREFDKQPQETRLLGKTLKDLSSIGEQDTVFQKPFDSQESSVLALRLGFTKEGALKAEAGRGSLLSEQAMEAYAKYAKLLTERALLEMEEGYIRPTPYDNHCEYCAYGGICGREEFLHGAPRTVGEVSEGTIVAAVDAEEGGYAHSDKESGYANSEKEGAKGDAAVATSPEGEKGNAAPFGTNFTLKTKGAAAAAPNFDLKNTQKEEG